METRRVENWKGFVSAVEDLRGQHGSHRRPIENGRIWERQNTVLFRGQPREALPLRTTLERRSREAWHVLKYVGTAAHYLAEIESITGSRWGVPDRPELEIILEAKQDVFRVELPAYDYLVYLRHNGFPSPLLDWTESPFIAAYFAYIDAIEEDVAVYCYVETPSGVKGGRGGDPTIHVMGPHVTTDARHFAQKAWYTVATRWKEEESKHYFCPHESVFERDDPKQDLLFKIVLPSTERGNVLRILNDFNINHFTLFQSTQALIRALASREFDLRGRQGVGG